MKVKNESCNDTDIQAALIGGVGFFPEESGEKIKVLTPYGEVCTYLLTLAGKDIALIPRHAGSGGHIPPHMINYRANIYAIKKLGIDTVISSNSVGSMRNHPLGSFFLPDDFIDFTKNRPSTFFDEKTVHANLTEPYCPHLRSLLRTIFENRNLGYSEGVYVCTEGPRFETKAEIRMFRQFGDVVGMTGLPELVLAREMNMCYASVCTVTNDACGLGNANMTVSEVLDILEKTSGKLKSVLSDLISVLPAEKSCKCMSACSDAQL